jgi:hypothetical protein
MKDDHLVAGAIRFFLLDMARCAPTDRIAATLKSSADMCGVNATLARRSRALFAESRELLKRFERSFGPTSN